MVIDDWDFDIQFSDKKIISNNILNKNREEMLIDDNENDK
jgi:hypothetical protein